MSSSKPLHSGPMLPLALMALFAIMIPVISIANSNQKVERTSAMNLKYQKPTPTPENVIPTIEPSPKTVVRPGGNNRY